LVVYTATRFDLPVDTDVFPKKCEFFHIFLNFIIRVPYKIMKKLVHHKVRFQKKIIEIWLKFVLDFFLWSTLVCKKMFFSGKAIHMNGNAKHLQNMKPIFKLLGVCAGIGNKTHANHWHISSKNGILLITLIILKQNVDNLKI